MCILSLSTKFTVSRENRNTKDLLFSKCKTETNKLDWNETFLHTEKKKRTEMRGREKKRKEERKKKKKEEKIMNDHVQ